MFQEPISSKDTFPLCIVAETTIQTLNCEKTLSSLLTAASASVSSTQVRLPWELFHSILYLIKFGGDFICSDMMMWLSESGIILKFGDNRPCFSAAPTFV